MAAVKHNDDVGEKKIKIYTVEYRICVMAAVKHNDDVGGGGGG